MRAKEVLKNNMKGLTELAELLLEKEVIFGEDLERIFGKRKADLLKEEKEALANPKEAITIAEGVKEDKKGKKSDKETLSKSKAKSGKKENGTGDLTPEKAVKKSKDNK